MTQEIYAKSVTANDLNIVSSNGTVIRYVVPFWNSLGGSVIPLPPDPPDYWSMGRDITLRSTIHHEAMWAAALGIAITKMAGLSFEVTSSVPLRAKRAQELLLQADGRRVGWVGFIAKQLRDYLTTDNGQFFEIVRSTSSLGSRIVGLRHLDSLRCTRTGDPERPVIFRDRRNQYHVLRDHQVVMLSDMPDPSELWLGVGTCAASRAYHAIYKLATIEWYLREKVSGLHPLSIYVVNGMTGQQIDDAVKSAESDKITRGVTAYMGAVVIGVPKDSPPDVVEIPLASLPDRFDRKQEFDLSVLTYADSIGLDVQDLQPLTGQPLGTGAQSQVLDDKSKGKGLSAWRQDFTHALNEYVLDDMTTFAFIERDYRDQERSAAVQKAHADISKVRKDAGITTPQQELQVLVDYGDLPKEFLPKDQTPGDSYSDTDKPEQEDAAQEGVAADQPEDPEKPEKPETNDAETKEAVGDISKSVMVALMIPAEVAKSIVVPDGNPVDDLHITLAYLGDGGVDTVDREKLEEITRHIASETPAVTGVINGRGMFETGEKQYAHFLTLDSPGLSALRQRVVDGLKEAGLSVVENHGFVPHITLTYSKSDKAPNVALPDGEVRIPALTIGWGEERVSLPFAGEKLKASDASLEEAEKLIAKVFAGANKRLVDKEITEKHLPGRHNQKRHAWRYGGLTNIRRSLRGQSKTERDEYRRRAGMPEPKKVSKPAPKPASSGPDGIPVSGKLRVDVDSPKRLGNALKDTLDVIDSVHGDGNLPVIPIKKSSGTRTAGEFAALSIGGGAQYIRVSDKSTHPMMTAAHEIGHFLDHSGDVGAMYKISNLRGIKYQPPRFAEAASKVWEKIVGSQGVARLTEHASGKPIEISGTKYNPDSRYLHYLLSPRELWARAYAQYIATRSGNRAMLAELKGLQSEEGYSRHWSDEDFAPIGKAIDDLFVEVGWRK